MHYVQQPEIDKSIRMIQFISRSHEVFCQKQLFFPTLLVFMKLSGCVLAESAVIFLIIRYDTIGKCLFGYLALCIVAKTDNLMAMTLPNTDMPDALFYKKNLGINDDIVELKSWQWNKDTWFKNLGLTFLLVLNRIMRFTYVTVYFYFLPFLAVILADLLTRGKLEIDGDFTPPQ